MKGILVFIVAYDAQAHIERTLERIPAHFWQREQGHEILLIDDASADETVLRAHQWTTSRGLPLTLFRNPVNQGYGGNQKLGYAYAIRQGFQAVILLHGDGQYAPELLDAMAAPILANEADLVLGSRMLKPQDALKGGMPLYKWVGNLVLTHLQNWLLGSALSEFHTGYRAWSVAAFSHLPFLRNSPDFDFDTEILIQSIQCKLRIKEIPIPTHYGTEISHVNAPKYALQVLADTIVSRLQNFGIFYTPKYDYVTHAGSSHYTAKLALDSSHTRALEACRPGDAVLDIGCSSGLLADALRHKNVALFGIDRVIASEHKRNFADTLEKDLDVLTAQDVFPGQEFHVILMLDVIEHLNHPELFLTTLRERFGDTQPRLVITAPNIAFILMRLNLLFGQFNYGKRGILDFSHRRLYTFRTLQNLLEHHGYRVKRVNGIPIPFELLLGDTVWSRIGARINNVLIAVCKSLFSYQIYIEAIPLPTASHLLAASQAAAGTLLEQKHARIG